MEEQKEFYDRQIIRSISVRNIEDGYFNAPFIFDILRFTNQKIIITESGELFLSNFPSKYYRLGGYRGVLGNTNINRLTLEKIPIPGRVVSVSATNDRMLILAKKTNGESIIYGMGSNRRNNLLGLADNKMYAFEPEVNLTAPANVKSIYINNIGNYYITNTGKLYYNGIPTHNNDGNLIGNRLIEFPVAGRVLSIVDALGITAVIIEPGLLFVKGHNRYGQLGLRNREYVNDFTQLMNADLIKSVSITAHTMAFITKKGKLFLIGDVYDGNYLTMDDKMTQKYIPLPFNEKVKRVSLGNSHIAILTVSGKLYTFGNNKDGQLATWDRERRNEPTLVDLPFLVKDVSVVNRDNKSNNSEFDSTLILGENGLLYTTNVDSFPLDPGQNNMDEELRNKNAVMEYNFILTTDVFPE